MSGAVVTLEHGRCSGHWNLSGEVITGTCMSKSGNCRKHKIWEQGKTQTEARGSLPQAVHTSWKAGVGRLRGKFYLLGLDPPSVSL